MKKINTSGTNKIVKVLNSSDVTMLDELSKYKQHITQECQELLDTTAQECEALKKMQNLKYIASYKSYHMSYMNLITRGCNKFCSY